MISGLNHITLAVEDLQRSFNFYTGVLGFDPAARWDKGAYLENGDIWLALLVDPKAKQAQRPDYSHIALSCTQDDFPALVQALEREGCASWSENVSEGDSFYFSDPDGHKLEIHVGDLGTRLRAMKENPWTEIQFFR